MLHSTTNLQNERLMALSLRYLPTRRTAVNINKDIPGVETALVKFSSRCNVQVPVELERTVFEEDIWSRVIGYNWRYKSCYVPEVIRSRATDIRQLNSPSMLDNCRWCVCQAGYRPGDFSRRFRTWNVFNRCERSCQKRFCNADLARLRLTHLSSRNGY